MQSTELSKMSLVKQEVGPGILAPPSSDLNWLRFVPIYRYHRPVQDYQVAARPGRRLAFGYYRSKDNTTYKNPKVNSPPQDFSQSTVISLEKKSRKKLRYRSHSVCGSRRMELCTRHDPLVAFGGVKGLKTSITNSNGRLISVPSTLS